jgi:hypothetical protein
MHLAGLLSEIYNDAQSHERQINDHCSLFRSMHTVTRNAILYSITNTQDTGWYILGCVPSESPYNC